MKRQPIWIALLLSTLAFAGCMGGGGGEAEAEGSATTETTGEGGVGANATATASASATNDTEDEGVVPTSTSGTGQGGDDEGPETKEEERSGTAETTGIVILDAPSEEMFTVEQGVTEFTLVVNASGGDLDVCIVSPTESDCAEEFETEEGEGSITVQAPSEGEWNVQLTPSGAGPQSVQYDLVFRQTLMEGDEDQGSQGQPTSTPSGSATNSPTGT